MVALQELQKEEARRKQEVEKWKKMSADAKREAEREEEESNAHIDELYQKETDLRSRTYCWAL